MVAAPSWQLLLLLNHGQNTVDGVGIAGTHKEEVVVDNAGRKQEKEREEGSNRLLQLGGDRSRRKKKKRRKMRRLLGFSCVPVCFSNERKERKGSSDLTSLI